jgi:DNA-binding MarR family transcriptional regulator
MQPQNQTGCAPERGTTDLPLPTLLSQALVAYTIEFDNEFERRMPHRTTNLGGRQGPWLVSMAMYFNCMQFVCDDDLTVGELEQLARTPTNLDGMRRWGYIVLEPGPGSRSRSRVGQDWIIRATVKGKMAREVWRPLFGAIEERWQERFGGDEVERLRGSLLAVVGELDTDLPDCLPILGYGLFSKVRELKRKSVKDGHAASDLKLATLLSRVLLAFAVDFENESELSLAICANVLRVLNEKGVQVRDLPLLSGVSKEAISMALGFLGKRGLVMVQADPIASRGKVARLTATGVEAQSAYRRRMGTIEKRWRERFGEDRIRALRESLGRLGGESLFRGLEPYPDGWRASVRKPDVLPHYPKVLRRGGYPDGS